MSDLEDAEHDGDVENAKGQRERIATAYQFLQEVEASDRVVAEALAITSAQAPAPPTLAGVIKTLSKQAHAAASTCAKALESADDCGAGEAALRTALDRLERAISIALRAQDAVTGSALAARRDALVAYLSAPIPRTVSSKQSEAYKNLASELATIQLAVNAIIAPPEAARSDPQQQANQVTSRVTDDVHVETLSEKPTMKQQKQRLRVAEARVRFGSASAVVITYPLAGGSAE